MNYIEEALHESKKEIPVYEAQENEKFLGFFIESWYDCQLNPLNSWGAFSKNIGNTSGRAREIAINSMKNKILWNQPTLPIIHNNAYSSEKLNDKAKGIKNQLIKTTSIIYKSKLNNLDTINLLQVLDAINEYVQAHIHFFKNKNRNKDKIKSRTSKILNDWKFKEVKFNEHYDTTEITQVVKNLKITLNLFTSWEFNPNDYHIAVNTWKDAKKERTMLHKMLSYTTQELSNCIIKK